MIRDRRVLVVYDITDNKRRRKLFKFLKGFGIRTQFSFFECLLSDVQVVKLTEGIRALISIREDKVGILVLCEHCFDRIHRMGYSTPEIFTANDLIV